MLNSVVMGLPFIGVLRNSHLKVAGKPTKHPVGQGVKGMNPVIFNHAES